MIRIVTIETDANAAAHVGGPVAVRRKTFDVACDELEQWLKGSQNTYVQRWIDGCEVIEDD